MSAVAYDEVASERDTRYQAMPGKILAGKRALVTGGSRGIGKAVALLLAEAGATVAVNYQHSAGAAEEVCQSARDFGAGSPHTRPTFRTRTMRLP